MEAQDRQVDEVPAPEVIAALLDLARLSHRAELAILDAPDAIAALLLERLLTLCGAQRGAALLTIQGREKPRTYREKTFRTFAMHEMNEEEALALLATCSLDGADLQTPSAEPCCVICRLPVSVPLSGEQVTADYRYDYRTDQYHAGRPGIAGIHPATTVLPLYALLVLVWAAHDERSCLAPARAPNHPTPPRATTFEKGKVMLPLIADATGAVIMNVLLAERVHELEAAADRKALREIDLLKAELLATVSHELRSPLASIKGYAATLLRHERRIPREEQREFLLAINEASDRLAAVIDRLLEMSQLETGSITIERSSVDLAFLVREAITSIELRLGAPEREASTPDIQRSHDKSGTYTFTLRPQDGFGMPTRDEPIIQADRHRLREVLDNLLENAITYSPEGGAIEVVVCPLVASRQASRSRTVPGNIDHDKKVGMSPSVPKSRQIVEICVRDQGIGIPSAHLERIFDRFHRVDTSLTRQVNGIGLGLAICKRIVELHGGMIWAESEVGKGSAFHVWLPVDMHT